MAATQPTLPADWPTPEHADDYQTWVEAIRPAFTYVAAAGIRFVSWQVKRAFRLPEAPNPNTDWGRALARFHHEGLVEHAGFDHTRDKSCVNAWRGTPQAQQGEHPMTPEEREALTAALNGTGDAIVCYARCWGCMFGQHYNPPQPHPWADDEDREHAAATGQPEPTGTCGCHCARPAAGEAT